MLVPKEDGHTFPFITLLIICPWSRSPPLLAGSQKIITLGHIPCNRWSARHSLTLVTTYMGVQRTTKAGLQKQRMGGCLEDRTRCRARVSRLNETEALR